MSLSKVVTLLLIGTVAGILIAPAKGSETRRKLSKLFNDVSDSMQDMIDLFHDKAVGQPQGMARVENTLEHQ